MPAVSEIYPHLDSQEIASLEQEESGEFLITKELIGKLGNVATSELLKTSEIETNLANQTDANERIYLNPEFTKLEPELKKAILDIKPLGTLLDTLERYGDPDIEKGQDVNLENIVFIRAADFYPVEKGGKFVVETPYEATKNEEDPDMVSLRLTSHWTLNHKVTSHMMGNWEGAPYTILAPGKQMVEINGAPTDLYPIDTFWTRSLELPKGTAIISVDNNFENRLDIIDGVDVIHVKPNEPVDEVISLVMNKMGFSEMSGGSHGSASHEFEKQVTTTLADKMGVELRGKHESAALHGNLETLIEVGFENSFASLLVSRDEARRIIVNERWDQLPQKMKDLLIDRMDIIPDIDSIGSTLDEQIERTNALFSNGSRSLPEVYRFERRKEIFDKKPPEFWISYVRKLFQLEKQLKDAGKYDFMSKVTEIETDRFGYMSEGYIKSLAELIAGDNSHDSKLEELENRLRTEIGS
ncbi:MAG TPA: hypothetical protein VMR51_00480 [Patescibacteria group bacterium]|nr:hypothetical protein [Patescibacteria group bacterium]